MFSAACGSGAAENANMESANTESVEQQITEAPVYTDAETALAGGNELFDQDEIEKAVEAYKQAAKLNPELAEAHFKLGIALALIENEQELVITSTEPDNSADTPKEEKKSNSVIAFENAVTAYKKILKKNPKDDVGHYNLGRAYDRLNDDKEARKSLEQAVKLQPENMLYQMELGAVLIKLAQYDEAVRALRKAAEADDANEQVRELLEEAEAGKKRVDFGAEKLKETRKGTIEPPKSGKARKEDSGVEDSADSEKKEPEKKATPKPAPTQPKKPAPVKSA